MKMKISFHTPWLIVTFFALAMGLLETIVVIYLRELYYPEGFNFPLKPMKLSLISTELLREFSTLVMLLTLGILAGRNLTTRFAWFLYSFAVWDIAYYLFLKLLIGWPESLLTWDILFLIPVTWVGPVAGPLINSAVMILLAIVLIQYNKLYSIRLNTFEWFLLITGSLIVVIAYTREYCIFMFTRFSMAELITGSNPGELMAHASKYLPEAFDWLLYASGVLLHLLAVGSLVMRRPSA